MTHAGKTTVKLHSIYLGKTYEKVWWENEKLGKTGWNLLKLTACDYEVEYILGDTCAVTYIGDHSCQEPAMCNIISFTGEDQTNQGE